MKKLEALALMYTAFLGCLPTVFYAEGPRPNDQITTDPFSDLTTDEYVFAAQLNDNNRQSFIHMTSAQRAECMHMTVLFDSTGNTLSPDAAVEKVLSTIQNKE